jgi:arylsulfatase A-like enzyme
VSEEQRQQLATWDREIQVAASGLFGTTSISAYYDIGLERAGIDRQSYFGTRRGLYDETMTHQDHALEELVAALKKRGEWENTLLVIGSDHGHPAGTFARFGRGLLEPQPEPWQGALFDAYATRIPLIWIWPGRIVAGRRIDQPVSMIDVLPTILDLTGLPQPEVLQGHSLAPLLRGQSMEAAPVILDEFRVDEPSGEMVGNLEIIDGRWGASLEIGPVAEGADPELGRHPVPVGGRWGAVHPLYRDVPRLLLYDLEADPYVRHAVNDEHPELVAHYRELLLEQWRAHRALAERFGDTEAAPLTPEQLRQLRALGYIP